MLGLLKLTILAFHFFQLAPINNLQSTEFMQCDSTLQTHSFLFGYVFYIFSISMLGGN